MVTKKSVDLSPQTTSQDAETLIDGSKKTSYYVNEYFSKIQQKDYGKDTTSKINDYKTAANLYHYENNYQKSNDILFELIKTTPSADADFSVYNLIATNYRNLKDKSKADKYFSLAIDRLKSDNLISEDERNNWISSIERSRKVED